MQAGHKQAICSELLVHLSDYVDGELEAALCSEIEAHLARCPDCRIMVDTVRKVIGLYRTAAAKELPSDVEARLFEALKLSQ